MKANTEKCLLAFLWITQWNKDQFILVSFIFKCSFTLYHQFKQSFTHLRGHPGVTLSNFNILRFENIGNGKAIEELTEIK